MQDVYIRQSPTRLLTSSVPALVFCAILVILGFGLLRFHTWSMILIVAGGLLAWWQTKPIRRALRGGPAITIDSEWLRAGSLAIKLGDIEKISLSESTYNGLTTAYDMKVVARGRSYSVDVMAMDVPADRIANIVMARSNEIRGATALMESLIAMVRDDLSVGVEEDKIRSKLMAKGLTDDEAGAVIDASRSSSREVE